MHDSGLSAGVDAQLLPALEREKTTQLLRSGQTLFCEGGPAHGVHCVQSGLLKLYKLGVGGEPLLLRLCGPGTLLGLRSVLADEAHEATAEAIQDSVVCSLPRLNFEVCVGSSPAMAVRIMREFAIEMREAHERMMELAHCDVLQRAAHLLVSIHEQALCPTPSRRSPGAHLKHMDLAAMIGTSPETMSRVLHTLDRRGVIKVTGDGIQVVDVAKLTAIARIPAVPGRA
jgi:CRP-like cAMP-binding protein